MFVTATNSPPEFEKPDHRSRSLGAPGAHGSKEYGRVLNIHNGKSPERGNVFHSMEILAQVTENEALRSSLFLQAGANNESPPPNGGF